MKLFLRFLFDLRVLSVIGLIALATFLFLGADYLRVGAQWVVAALCLIFLGFGLVWLVKKVLAIRAAKRLERGIDAAAEEAEKSAQNRDKAAVAALRTRMDSAVKTIKTSKLGQMAGKAALYELPWYMVIGNPAAGKSTAIAKSGLNFPFADQNGAAVHGIGGTRNCDWFFTSDGILLDTAGRYSVHDEDRTEWLGFLRLLKRSRPMAPINGILIAVSVAELSSATPDMAIKLAKNLRQRVQELAENLEVFAPVYLVFTKMDLVSGFVEFFADRDASEREKVWGATLPYKTEGNEDAVAQFDRHFDELREGLKELTLARMSLQRGQALPTGVLSFPLEFNAMKPTLRAFVATLFEDNPFQFKPVFRGFYFTSSVQDGDAQSPASAEVARQFGLQAKAASGSATVMSESGYFLRDLFAKVVFADRNLVKQYASRNKQKLRAGIFVSSVLVLGMALAGWAWSYLGNRQLMHSVEADMRKAVSLQADKIDLASRLEALEVLQQRIEELSALRQNRPLGLSLGLYQGETIERKLREEYFAGVRQVMLQPVAQAVEGYLAEVNQNAASLSTLTKAPISGAAPIAPTGASAPAAAPVSAGTVRSRYADISTTSSEEAYNALKTYLMLAERERMESAHLTDQLTRFWRVWLEEQRGSMPRDAMVRSAERLMAFSMANLLDPSYPLLENNLGLVDQTRENLRKVMRGMPARERVYADIKARAATRFAPMTVARMLTEAGQPPDPQVTPSVAGSYAISGTFTRQAWDEYVEKAIKEASNSELQRVDWVLNVRSKDDLSLEGSTEQIRAALTEMYKNEYVTEWKKFTQGVAVAEFKDFKDAVFHLNRLGDGNASPLKIVLEGLFDQTAWDNPSIVNERLGKAQKGVADWFKQSILRMSPSRVDVSVNVTGEKTIPMGPIGREFAGLPHLMISPDSNPTYISLYMKELASVRSRYNDIANQGDVGPGADKLMSATLEAGSSELHSMLKFIDENMLRKLTPAQRNTLRPLMVRPLMEAYRVVIEPAEREVNRRWTAEVYEPFQRKLANKYPFDTNSRIEAPAAEIETVFGPNGSIALFGNNALGKLVVRRGNDFESRTWAGYGIGLTPEFVSGYPKWVLPLDGAAAANSGGGGGAAGGGGGGAAASQSVLQILPQGAPGLTEYTITIDGQTLRYRNTAATWTNFVWPNPTGVAGVKITGVTLDGKQVEFLNEPGNAGFERMLTSAKRKRLPSGDTELVWTSGNLNLPVHLKVVRTAGATEPPPSGGGGGGSAAAPQQPGSPVPISSLRGVKLPQVVVGKGKTATEDFRSDGLTAAEAGASK